MLNWNVILLNKLELLKMLKVDLLKLLLLKREPLQSKLRWLILIMSNRSSTNSGINMIPSKSLSRKTTEILKQPGMPCQLMMIWLPNSKVNNKSLLMILQHKWKRLTQSKHPWTSSLTPSTREKSLIDKLKKKNNSDNKQLNKPDKREN